MSTQALTITDSAGRRLAALYDAPLAPQPHPLVILLHGFTGWKEEAHLEALAGALAAAGIAALRFDAPGSGESGGSWADDYRVSHYLRDVQDVFDYAVSELGANPTRIGLWGHSMGGMVALLAAAAREREYRAVCGCEPSSGQTGAFTAEQIDQWQKSGWHIVPSEHHGPIRLPYAYYAERSTLDTARAVTHLACPALFIAGTFDKSVPAVEVKRIFEAAPQPKQYLEFATGHGYKNYPEVLADITAVTTAYFQEHL
jgi:pimeloyl-ACP methyl ester carboxylesterase